jgi:fructose PTS system EIIBC or EIIC component
VLPSLLAGSAVTGGLSAAFGVAAATPHGGIFVLPLVGNPLGYILAIAAGTLVSAATVLALKAREQRMRESRTEDPLCHDP